MNNEGIKGLGWSGRNSAGKLLDAEDYYIVVTGEYDTTKKIVQK